MVQILSVKLVQKTYKTRNDACMIYLIINKKYRKNFETKQVHSLGTFYV